jgi:hypothetical protein
VTQALTPARAREIIRAQSRFPYWGNYQRFLTPDELAEVQGLFEQSDNGSITFAGIVQRRARADVFDAPPNFDERDVEIARERLAEWNELPGPRVGDWVKMLDGTVRRFTHDWGDEIQTTSASPGLCTVDGPDRESGSFYFHGSGMSFSGGLDRSIPKAGLVETEEVKEGRAWFFHHGHSGAHRGVHFTVPCRVFKQVAP